ncbi:MAG: membrane protein [Chloroflexota bacterium]|nr:MAG: membrane protein [Chloroflexota bacterium]
MLAFARFIVVWLVDMLSLLLAAWLAPGITLVTTEEASAVIVAISAALLLAVVNLLIRPAILLIARPLGWVALFVIGFFVNAIALWITAWLLPNFDVTWIGALVGGLVFAFFNAVLTGILELDEEGSFYQNRIERRAREQPFDSAAEPGRGLMMVEIDGLSYWHIKKALDDGLLPTLERMITEYGYQLTRFDCGLPSMTSSCQAGIMFGDNHDIPAYRWYDKSKQKVYVSASDAAELNARYAKGHGLMRHGSSIMNMLNGDAEKSMFTMANLFAADEEEKKRRAQDVALLLLNPYFLTRELAIFFVEVIRELWEAWQQKRKNVWPRINRLAHGYPFLRAAMSTLMRDISAQIAILDMMRGAPSIYMLYLGYDEVAHHSGPWTSDAFGDLKRLDKTLARLLTVAKEKASRPYDLIILSDHGQSFGPTFLQRYGVTIKEFIEQQLPQGTSVNQSIGGDTGAFGLQGVAGELANMQDTKATNAVNKAVAKQGQKLAQIGAAHHEEDIDDTPASVTAYGSGNAAQVYFDLFPRKIKLSELNAAYPGMVDALVQHEGIGMVLGYEDDMTVVVLGKGGRRNLHTGEVIGADPVAPYAPAEGVGAGSIEKRVWQLRRVMEFPNAGDLWLISTVYPDGTVAALEELIGNHGGLGGEQTDAFIFHPADMDVPETRCSTDVFHILNNHRNAPIIEKTKPVEPIISAWAPATLWQGIKQWRLWLRRALGCLLLDRTAYQEVADDPYMTGPALLMATMLTILITVSAAGMFSVLRILIDLISYFLSVAVVFAAAYTLTRRGSFTRTFRTMGFARSVGILSLLAPLLPYKGVVALFMLVLGFLMTWLGVAVAHDVRGWRAFVLPVLALLVIALGSVVAVLLLAGTGYTVNALLQDVGIIE